ncbi:MAG: hypothetical protein M3410_06090 [Acidobacteriota bacterium]|nr:hypothetical protein [Acidobacteriota bacterium]
MKDRDTEDPRKPAGEREAGRRVAPGARRETQTGAGRREYHAGGTRTGQALARRQLVLFATRPRASLLQRV